MSYWKYQCLPILSIQAWFVSDADAKGSGKLLIFSQRTNRDILRLVPSSIIVLFVDNQICLNTASIVLELIMPNKFIVHFSVPAICNNLNEELKLTLSFGSTFTCWLSINTLLYVFIFFIPNKPSYTFGLIINWYGSILLFIFFFSFFFYHSTNYLFVFFCVCVYLFLSLVFLF